MHNYDVNKGRLKMHEWKMQEWKKRSRYSRGWKSCVERQFRIIL